MASKILPQQTLIHPLLSHGNSKDITNQNFGRLTAIEPVEGTPGGIKWRCICSCGNEHITTAGSLRKGATKSCGCLGPEQLRKMSVTHGMSKEPIYKVWQGMIKRCGNKNSTRYKYYGKRGIRVCRRWVNSFENFYADMGDPPANKSIDRINNDGNYKPGNCRWATRTEQTRNMRNNVMLTFYGTTMCVTEWAERTGIRPGTIYQRLRRGWSDARALSTSVADTLG